MTPSSDSTAPVCLQTLTVRRLAGVAPDRQFTLQDLPAGLVILHGPNGSGKSTTAAAIQELLWPEPSAHHLDLNARVHQGTDQWELEAHGQSITALQGSQTLPHPCWAPSELRGRYSWSLNDLLRAEDGDLAAILAAEMAGGIDFPQLTAALGWDKEPSAPLKKAREFKEADKQIRSLQSGQQALRKESATLETLQSQRDQAVRQRDRLPLIQAALKLQTLEEEHTGLQRTLDSFSEGAKQVRPGDAERMKQALEKQDTCAAGLRNLERDQSDTAARNPLPDLPLDDDTLKGLHHTLEQTETQWRETVRERHQAEEQLAGAGALETRLRERLGITDPGSEDLQGYDLPDLRSWVEIVLEVEQSALVMREAEKELDRDPDAPAMDNALLQELRLVTRRLREHLDGTTRRGTPPFWIACALLGAVLILQVRIDALPPAWLAVLPALALTPLAWELLHRGHLIRRIQTLLPEELSFTETTPAGVRGLQRTLDRLEREPELRRRLEEATQSHQQNVRILEALKERVEATGITPIPSREWCRNVLEDMQQWRQAADAVHQAEAVLSEREKRLDALLSTFRRIWSELNLTPRHEDPAVESLDVRQRIDQALSSRQHLRHLDQQKQDLTTRQNEIREEIRGMTARLQLETPDPAAVQELEAAHTRWESAFRRSEVLHEQVSDLRNRLKEDPELLELESPALGSLESESRAAATREEELRDRITRLTQKIELAQTGRTLHQAMEDREAVKTELLEERERMARQLAGRAILDWLQDACRSGEQPGALEEANRLLAGFTRGHLRLTLDLTPEGHVFQAACPGETPRGLQDLSTGERTQVLMAVRLAFLKRNERAPLPLLVDEVLGTSDDQRADAIMRTLLHAAREGRQIFYFTAQTDEVGKWKKALESYPGLPHAFIDLHALRTGAPSTPIRLPEASPALEDPARRSGESRADWAARLGVPAWSGHDPVGSFPLFLLMEQEEKALTACLRFGITTWGPLQHLLDTGSTSSLLPSELIPTLRARADALEALAEAWRIGRPPPVDPATVMESGIVSDAFADEILRVLRETGYNAARFLEALENKAVSRWRQDNTDQLRSLFYQQGTLTDETPLEDEALLSHALGLMDDPDRLAPEDWQRMSRFFLHKIFSPYNVLD